MSVTAPDGFRASGVAAGIRGVGGLDLALVVNDGPSRTAAGVFTTNRVKAAPVLWSEQVLRSGAVTAVVLNSGGANACTGRGGFHDTHATAERVAAVLAHSAAEVAVCSTGVIGERLPMEAVLGGVDAAAAALASDADAGRSAARAIMTTDTVAKTTAVARDGYSVGGMAKGAGMLAPGLATMLVVLTTDAEVPANLLDRVLRSACTWTFERVDSDGCMSTNDTVLALASGASGLEPAGDDFAAAVHEACADLARQLVSDAEGATKEVEIRVRGAASEADALEVGRAVARSSLLKCALYGQQPYWGRVLAAAGATHVAFEPDRVAVAFNGVWVCRDGQAADDGTKADLSARAVEIVVDLAAGEAETTIWTNDLSPAYIAENASYAS